MIAENVPIPIVPYNIPSRTGVNLLPEMVAKLAKIKNIVGIKEASGSLKQASDIVNPIPVKAALYLMGKIDYEFRLPLCKMADGNFEKLRKVMINYSLIL